MLSTIPSGTGRALAKQSSLGVMLKEVHQLVASMGKLLCLVLKAAFSLPEFTDKGPDF